MRKTDHVGRKLHSGNEVRTENSSHIPKLTNVFNGEECFVAVVLAYFCFSRAFCLKLEAVLRVSTCIIITPGTTLGVGNGRETL